MNTQIDHERGFSVAFDTKELILLVGEENLRATLLVFTKSARKQLKSLDQRSSTSSEVIHRIAHQALGAARQLRLTSLQNAAKEVLEASMDGAIDKRLIDKLSGALQSSIEEVNQYLSANKHAK